MSLISLSPEAKLRKKGLEFRGLLIPKRCLRKFPRSLKVLEAEKIGKRDLKIVSEILDHGGWVISEKSFPGAIKAEVIVEGRKKRVWVWRKGINLRGLVNFWRKMKELGIELDFWKLCDEFIKEGRFQFFPIFAIDSLIFEAEKAENKKILNCINERNAVLLVSCFADLPSFLESVEKLIKAKDSRELEEMLLKLKPRVVVETRPRRYVSTLTEALKEAKWMFERMGVKLERVKVLDIGSGGWEAPLTSFTDPRVSSWLKKLGTVEKIVISDVDPVLLSEAEERIRREKVGGFEVKKFDVLKGKLGEKFNIITCFNLLYHLYPPRTRLEAALKNIIEHCDENAVMVLDQLLLLKIGKSIIVRALSPFHTLESLEKGWIRSYVEALKPVCEKLGLRLLAP